MNIENRESRVGYLQELCNKYGDFKVAYSYKNKDEETIWLKHKTVMECWSCEEGLKFLEKVNHRQILPNEIVIDIDDPNSNYITACNILDENKYNYKCYLSGSRGHHIHIKVVGMQLEPRWLKEKIREQIIKKLRADIQKKSDNTMIALENVPHWKTGNVKKLVKINGKFGIQ